MDESETIQKPTDPTGSTRAAAEAPPGAPIDEPVDEPVDASTGAVLRRLGPAAWLGVLWALLPALGGFALLVFIGSVGEWLRSNQGVGYAVYVTVFVLAAGFGFLPTYAQAFVGGWAFGAVGGTAAALVGFVGASIIGRAIARGIVRGRVDDEIERHQKARAVRDALVGSGTLRTLGIVTLVRIPPNSPFALTNAVLATTGVPVWIYVIGTAVGMLPRTAAVVWLGSQFAQQFDGSLTTEALKDARPGWYLPVAIGLTVLVFLVLMQIGQRALERVTGPSSTPADEAG
jgi:uncharacterized membrane protein YdjX (TVP38/TMEM64 family)